MASDHKFQVARVGRPRRRDPRGPRLDASLPCGSRRRYGRGWTTAAGRRAVGGMLVLCALSWANFAAESPDSSAPAPGDRIPATNVQDTLNAFLHVEAQFRSNLVALEAYSQEAKVAAARNSEVLSNGLHQIAETFATQQEAFAARSAEERETMQRANQLLLMVVGAFAAIAVLVLLAITWVQWRMSRAWVSITAAPRGLHGLEPGAVTPALGAGDLDLAATARVEDSKRRLLGAMDQLERRVQELEQGPDSARTSAPAPANRGGNGESQANGGGELADADLEPAASDDRARIQVLLEQGKDRLKENDLDGALRSFDTVLSLDPDHGEALVKKGSTLERLQRLNEAFECYDRAIAADHSMTIAYLHKGGLCNRLERFKEALDCYEKALQTHDARQG